ncbi:MAG TPA: MEDS domain-containing protein [Trebonia sp.]
MAIPAAQDPSLGFAPGDHVCAFYSASRNVLEDIVVDYLIKGLKAGNKVFCMVDDPAAVRRRIPDTLVSREDMLHVLTEDEAYMPDARFSKEIFIRTMESMISDSSANGYESFRAVGDETFIMRHGVDINEWFAAESELNNIAPGFPHFFFCLYDLDVFDGNTVMRVLRTHPRVYVNGIIIGNPHYSQADRLPG